MTANAPAGLRPPALKFFGAFAVIYFVWGSTYLFIRFAIETIPPFVMAGARHTLAGLILYGWSRWRGEARPSGAQWASAAVLGGLMLFGGNGGVTWAQQTVASGVTALIVAAVPLWMAVLDWVGPGGQRPGARVIFGLVLGFAGIALLIGPAGLGGERVDIQGALVLVGASLSWAIGSLYSRQARLPASIVLAMATQSLAGGALLFLAAIPAGHWARFDVAAISLRSAGALLMLVVAGSILGFTCYLWLLRVTSAARVSTYAYVNPVFALLLGWLVAGERLAPRALVASAIIVAAVVMIVSYRDARAAVGADAPLRTEAPPPPRAETADLGCAAPAKGEL